MGKITVKATSRLSGNNAVVRTTVSNGSSSRTTTKTIRLK